MLQASCKMSVQSSSESESEFGCENESKSLLREQFSAAYELPKPSLLTTASTIVRRFSAGAVNNLQIGGALTRIIYSGVLLSKF